MILRFYNISVCVLFVLAFHSCKSKSDIAKPENAISVKVSHEVGSQWKKESKYLGLPGNLAEILALQDQNKCLILSQPLRAGLKLDVLPIGVLRLEVEETDLNIILSYPIDSTLQTIHAKDLDEFATIHSSSKWIIEQWFLNHLGMGKVTIKGWESQEYVVNNILNK